MIVCNSDLIFCGETAENRRKSEEKRNGKLECQSQQNKKRKIISWLISVSASYWILFPSLENSWNHKTTFIQRETAQNRRKSEGKRKWKIGMPVTAVLTSQKVHYLLATVLGDLHALRFEKHVLFDFWSKNGIPDSFK